MGGQIGHIENRPLSFLKSIFLRLFGSKLLQLAYIERFASYVQGRLKKIVTETNLNDFYLWKTKNTEPHTKLNTFSSVEILGAYYIVIILELGHAWFTVDNAIKYKQ